VSLDRTFRLSPLIRITLLLFYTALTLPLPFLAAFAAAPVPPVALAIALLLGGFALYAALCERVVINDQEIPPGFLASGAKAGHFPGQISKRSSSDRLGKAASSTTS
jgi:hypothetical protein